MSWAGEEVQLDGEEVEMWSGWLLPSQFKDHLDIHCLFSLWCNKAEVVIGCQEDQLKTLDPVAGCPSSLLELLQTSACL